MLKYTNRRELIQRHMCSGIVLLCMLICTSYQTALAAMHIIYVARQGLQQFQP
jgi:hypothetical protein